MESVTVLGGGSQHPSVDPLSFARSYQLEALEISIKQNTIVFLETGSGKTLIAIMLLRSYAYLLRKPSPFIAVFLVPQVVLVSQQGEAVKMHTDLNVGMYCGEMGVDFWGAAIWKKHIEKHEVLVMTPAILLTGLRHSFFKLSMIKVLIIDECHHAKGKHPYACIMTEFYHRQLRSEISKLPRIFGMTASPIKTKSTGVSEFSFWEKIKELETLMNSKVYTCASESVLAQFIPFSTPKFKVYRHKEIPCSLYAHLTIELQSLKEKHELSLKKSDLVESTTDSMSKNISKVFSALIFCLDELGVWLALKAAQSFSCFDSDLCTEADSIPWGKLDVFGETIVKHFSLDAFHAFSTYIPSGPDWSIGNDVKANMDAGLLTSKVVCLIESLHEYRYLKDIRCIVFVERIVTAIVLHSLLEELLPKYCSWKSKYIAGNNSRLQSQTRKKQNEIVQEFRKGMVNVIVATSILEEGLDVQSCNLVIRFDPSATVCSFIQSRGRARMKHSDYILMVKSEDCATQSRLEKYLASGDIMRNASLRHASLPCSPLQTDLNDEKFYCVESTGATVTLSSSVSLIFFYCSRLPSDCYFKPAPRWDQKTCTLYLPKSCPLQNVVLQGNINAKILKQTACLEACKQLHEIGALTDNLVPDIVVEEADAQESGNEPYIDEQPCYFSPELVGRWPKDSDIMKYHCYLIELKQSFVYDIPVRDIVLVMKNELGSEVGSMHFDLDTDRGSLTVNFKYVLLCRRFQITLLRVLIDHNLNKLKECLDGEFLGDETDYLLLPATGKHQRPLIIDWLCVTSVLFSCENFCEYHLNCYLPKGCARSVQTKDGPVCICLLKNSLVCTPHNGKLYCITGILGLNANSCLTLQDGRIMTYKKYFEEWHGIKLRFDHESLVNGIHIFKVQNYLQRCREQKEKGSSKWSVELPPELCSIVMSPIPVSIFYSFSFVPSILHRLESLLIAVNLKRMLLDHCMQNDVIPVSKVLEAITTKNCQEIFHLESLETLGDSFLKYAVSQQLFKTYKNQHEGVLSVKKEKLISNAALCKFGCDRKLPGFIRNKSFDPKKWIIPGDRSASYALSEELLFNTRKIYIKETRKVKSKHVADVVEALIGALVSTGGETAAIFFMDWLGIKMDFHITPYERHFQVHAEKLLNVRQLENLVNYSFHDHSLLVEALTHGSYMLPEIPRCYQRLEFLGDSVLDYIITKHFYYKYPGLSPALLTDMRSASVNNDCYARSAVKCGLHKHILHASQELHKHIVETVYNFEKLSSESTFGWESDTTFPKVLGDVIESLAGAILVDSRYDMEVVFRSIRPLLEPLVTPETVKPNPSRELNELCQKEHYIMNKPIKSRNNGLTSITIEVEAKGHLLKGTAIDRDKKIAKKVACKKVLESMKRFGFTW
ncbi:endoribonuclease Dicer homolog 2 isoform X3 [Juglans microcarpa x Juglans regia]|uniref:endoribonuclease Dicer homolog 2 isoform X3 n=1 Tax=Juglans microcarpa x Juglans regia TaxID=2249226 RepID=UPI001B7EE3BA|nr:endoribonuclease Dicer homolog 2 isoform X3 [Juglans microcarpa x Juglans regia]